MIQNINGIFITLLILLAITQLNVERKRALFKLMKFNDNFVADKANLKEFQEALKFTENLEDKSFLKKSILLFQLQNILIYICLILFILCIALIVKNTNINSLNNVSESICYILFILLQITQINFMKTRLLFRGMKYNDSYLGSWLSLKELQEALKIARDKEDEMFLINTIRGYKLLKIIFISWLLSAILTLIISANKLEF